MRKQACGMVFLVLLSLAAPLRAEWELQWMRELPPRKAAWRFTERMPKDTAYEPVAQGDLVLIGCMHNDALLALCTGTV